MPRNRGKEQCESLSDGLRILARYLNTGVTAVTGEVYAGPITPIGSFHEDDIDHLEALGWVYDTEIQRWYIEVG